MVALSALLPFQTVAAPVTMQSQDGTTIPTLVIRTPFRFTERVVRSQAVSPASGGAVHRGMLHWSHTPSTTRPEHREWSVTWVDLDEDEVNLLTNLYRNTYGGALPFLWDLPEGPGETRVRFIGNGIQITRQSAGFWSAAIVVREDRA